MSSISIKTNKNLDSKILGYEDDIRIEISDRLNYPVLWDKITANKYYLKSKFLKLVEEKPPSSTSPRYACIYQDENLVGLIYFQINNLNLGEAMRVDRNTYKWYQVWGALKKTLLKSINHRLLIIGNSMVTGENSFYFEDGFDKERISEIVFAASEKIAHQEEKNGSHICSVLVKDFYIESGRYKNVMSDDKRYIPFKVQPNMNLPIRENWETFDNYLADMKAKARTRIKRAIKKSKNLAFRKLNIEEILANKEKIYSLYSSTANNASFNLFFLNDEYFQSFAKLPSFNLFGVFKEEKMIAFYTLIQSGNELDAHFLGYDPEENKEHQLYLNVLLQMIKTSIERNINNLGLSRTAMEIKSSVGAVPHEMNIYLRSRHLFIQWFLKIGLSYFIPENNWTPRSPFKSIT